MSNFMHPAQCKSTHSLTKERLSLKGARSMHSFARHRHGEVSKASTKETKGLVLNQGWRYDLMGWFCDTFLFRGQWREPGQKNAQLARIPPRGPGVGVGRGHGTLAIAMA